MIEFIIWAAWFLLGLYFGSRFGYGRGLIEGHRVAAYQERGRLCAHPGCFEESVPHHFHCISHPDPRGIFALCSGCLFVAERKLSTEEREIAQKLRAGTE